MAVVYHEESGVIDLNTENTTYQMKIGPCGLLLHTWYGPAVRGDMSVLLPERNRGYIGNLWDAGNDRSISAEMLPLEYSCEGNGDYRQTALSIRRESGVSGCDLRYEKHEILEKKYGLEGLPAVYSEGEDGAQTLLVTLADKSAGIEVLLQYGILPGLDVITRAVKITNTGEKTLTLQNAASVSLDFSCGEWNLIHFHGRHAGERAFRRQQIRQEEILVGSRRGASSHQQNPFVILCEEGASEEFGACFGVSLLYSGSFSVAAGMDPFGSTRLTAGIQPERFDYDLAPGESFQAPEAAIAFSTKGFSGLSHIFHRLIRKNICRGPWRDVRRPVLINNWEATGMDFDGEKIISIAKTAADLGVEMMVLDDGWFGARNDDTAGLGDWYVNEEKLGCSMGALVEKIRGMGMKFGLWIEPEMINEKSKLYETHPDWVLKIPGKSPVRGRNQLVLDFSRPEIVDAVFEQIAAVIDECRADYIKMDMNRSLCDIYTETDGLQSQGKVMYRYVLGVYRFMEKLLERYPGILLEGCAGGGGRFDAGMLYYCPQIWCSDNTDAIDRIRIQYGTSFGYPCATMGAHVSAVPNGDTGRCTPINTRAVVAMEGTFGYELDLNLISEHEKEEVRRQIETFQKYQPLLHDGDYYRLTNPLENREEAAWMMVSGDKGEALLNIVTLNTTGNSPNRYVRCRGLDGSALYEDQETGEIYSGAALMFGGIPIPKVKQVGSPCGGIPGEYHAFQIHFVRKTG